MAEALGGRELVKRQRHLPAVKIDLDHAVDRFADDDELVERGLEQAPLQMAIDDRYQNDETSMQGLGRIELPEVARVVGNEDEIALSGIADDIPVFPAGPPDTGDVLGFMAGYPRDSDQVDAEAFVAQKPHDTATVSSLRRLRRNGC